MAESPSTAHWSQLRATRPVTEDSLATLPIDCGGVVTGLSMAMDVAGNLHLLIPVQGGPSSAMPPDLNGLKVRHRRLETGEFLDLIANASHAKVFNPVCRDVI